MFLLLGAFIAGALTGLAPCVLPLLPIIIGGSVAGNARDKRRPVVIAISLAVSLIIFTLLLKASTLLINISPQGINEVSGGIIILLGLTMLFPTAYITLINRSGIESRAQRLLGKGYRSKSKLVGPIITGAALGPVFSSCSPVYAYILATVLPVNFGKAMLYLVAYVLGLSLLLLCVGYYGRQFVGRIRFAANPRGWFQRSVATIFIVVGVLVFTGYSQRVQTWFADHNIFDFNALSTKLLPPSQHATNGALFNVTPFAAPDFQGPGPWINSSPLTMSQLKGKVVLVDFWTYSCINCIRNNKYLEQWYQAYKDDGLVVVGVHAPEFAFEQVPANVRQGVATQHITYPVVLDNQLATWNAYANESWPAGYLINPQGQVVRIHEGEGGYSEEEQAIRQLLTANGAHLGPTTSDNDNVPITQDQTPETYLGYERAEAYAGNEGLASRQTQTYTGPSTLDVNEWDLGGKWEVDAQYIVARGNSTISIRVAAKDVYLVGGGPNGDMASIGVRINGKPVSQTGDAGADIAGDTLPVSQPRLYHLASFPAFSSDSTITLTVPDGVQLNTFTFGS
ncbi:MAG TPA: cytochrome c biogenesis protein CcdA [Patescibacteria group bacterium]|nr:cytochrome c biogenesis protein CcdA [Patescibacteria group bacterium]